MGTRQTKAQKVVTAPLSLLALVKALGEATDEEARWLVEAVTDEQLVREGAEVTTQRVTDDAIRIYGAAAVFFTSATDAQREEVLLDPEVIRIGAWAALQGDTLARSLAKGQADKATGHAAMVTAAEMTVAQTRTIRDQCAEALRGALGGDVEKMARLSSALRPAASGQPEAGPDVALASLVVLGREVLASRDAAVVKRAGFFGVTEARLGLWAKAAESGAEARELIAAPKVGRATQADVDRWDGINLRILNRVTGAFAVARALYPSIPALRKVSLRRASPRKKTAETEPNSADKKPTGESDPLP